MPDGLDDLLGDNTGTSTADGQPKGGGLRAQLEAVLAERQALKEQLTKLETAQRQRDLDGLFDKYKIPALAKDFYPKDAELDDKSAADFVAKYGQLWGHQPPAAETPAPEQAAATAMQQASAQGTAPVLKPMGEDEYRAKFAEAKNMAELRQMMAELGSMQL
jgi:hypothetical protein